MLDKDVMLKSIKDRTEEVGECWIWTQAVGTHGYPILKPKGCGCKLVRRLSAELAGHDLKPRQPVATTCGEKLCVNPDHMQPSDIKTIAQAASARGAFSTRGRAAKIAAGRRNGKTKLDQEAANAIRDSADTEVNLAKRYGVNRSLIGRIRRGDAWRDYTNPFSGLGAR